MADEQPKIPPLPDYFNPVLAALRSLGGKASIKELEQRVIAGMGLPPEVVAIPSKHPSFPSAVAYRIAWARTYLKNSGYIHNVSRGTWALTDLGLATDVVDEHEIVARVREKPSEADDVSGDPPDDAVLVAFDELVLAPLRMRRDEMRNTGLLPVGEKLEACYRRFRERFGPDALAGLDGEPLLRAMHGRGTKDSLVYWLEFKDDDELPGYFGSISGGSALKFGIYQSVDNQNWFTGTSTSQRMISLEEAISIAREQRDQFRAGAAVLAELAPLGERIDYSALHGRLVAAAPMVANLAWGHKYFSLLFPAILDSYHSPEYQRYHITTLLQSPRAERYANDGVLLDAARHLELPMAALGLVLNDVYGGPRDYWRVGTTDPGRSDEWPRMRDGGFVSVGWSELGDLSSIEATQESKDRLRTALAATFPAKANIVSRKSQELFNFVARMQARDVIVAMDGATVRGVGVVAGGYLFQPGDGPFAHRRPVQWLAVGDWKLPQTEGLLTTVCRLGKVPENLVAIERSILLARQQPTTPLLDASPTPPLPPLVPLQGVVARVDSALRRKRQVILYGPPGTGKTYHAVRAARELAARSWHSRSYDALGDTERHELTAHAVESCAFHPAFGYEDFMEGYRPAEANGQLSFVRKDGIFKRLCGRAAARPDRSFFLLIDEINRGDVPRIFGELLTVLEKDKRGQTVTLPLSGAAFLVPDNVFVIATMNTADRSIALLDAALRRRFAFIELMPASDALGTASVAGLPLGPWLTELNRRVVDYVGRDARNLQVGHAYLMPGGTPVRDVARFAEILRDDIVPLLEEYCYDDAEALVRILGKALIRKDTGRLDDALFEAQRGDDLIEAVLKSFDRVTATTQAVTAEAAQKTLDDDMIGAVDEG